MKLKCSGLLQKYIYIGNKSNSDVFPLVWKRQNMSQALYAMTDVNHLTISTESGFLFMHRKKLINFILFPYWLFKKSVVFAICTPTLSQAEERKQEVKNKGKSQRLPSHQLFLSAFLPVLNFTWCEVSYA